MKRIIFIISTICIVCMTACKTKEVSSSENIYGVSISSAKTLKPDTLNAAGLDSLVKADKLPAFSKWVAAAFIDDETQTTYYFRTLFDSRSNIVYTVKSLNPSLFVVSKRKLATK